MKRNHPLRDYPLCKTYYAIEYHQGKESPSSHVRKAHHIYHTNAHHIETLSPEMLTGEAALPFKIRLSLPFDHMLVESFVPNRSTFT